MIRKRFLFVFLLIYLHIGIATSFSQSFWVQKAGGLTPDEGADISIDANGNTYTTGYFTGSATFGSTTLTSAGVTDVFITKLNNNGLFQWAVRAGGATSDKAYSIKADAAGNTYITGYYYGSATFGTNTITSAGNQDVFIAKYNTAGLCMWVKSAGGSGADIGNGITVDNSGNVLVTGEFQGSATFGATALNSAAGSVDVFTTKLDASGNFIWAKKGSGNSTDRGIDIAADGSGNVYVTGQFSDTITFDLIHNNTMFNAIFLIKYNNAGQEQWFKVIGGASYNVGYGIASDGNSGIYLTGDFQGNLIFFGTPNTTLSNTYVNRVFVAKYDTGGNLIWTHADGSTSEITSKNITADATGNTYIVGGFKCKLNEYANQYGQGTFNSVGYRDIFVTKYSSVGNWQWSRQCASKQDDYGTGIAVNSTGEVTVSGSFSASMMFTTPSNFLGYNTTAVNAGGSYCNNANYYSYQSISPTGNLDIIIAKNFDPAREPYDYYMRTGTGCATPFIGVCINNNPSAPCPDTITNCGVVPLQVVSNVNAAGPNLIYQWSNSSSLTTYTVNATGYYWVTQSSVDGCFQSIDSIYVHILTPGIAPPVPTISDDVVVNTNAIMPIKIYLCQDSTLLTAGNIGTSIYGWSGPNTSSSTTTIMATESGTYAFTVTDTSGCVPVSSSNSVDVVIDSIFDPLIPLMLCHQDTDGNDSIDLCQGATFGMYVYDSITNPTANSTCFTDTVFTWSITPANFNYANINACDNNFAPTQSGTYTITATIIRHNHCGWDTSYAHKTIYVNIHPLPVLTTTVSIAGNQILCPGDTSLLIATGTPFNWFGPGLSGSTQDSVYATLPGLYVVISDTTYIDSVGCTTSSSSTATINVNYPPQPIAVLASASSVICPSDSVQLFCQNGSGTYLWLGPTGNIGVNTNSVYVYNSGLYYCVVSDTNGCTLVTNTILVNQYATPYLYAAGNGILCSGDSLTITAVTVPGSVLVWQAPLTGNSTAQVVHSPGTYVCIVTACGIQTVASINITLSTLTATITASGNPQFCYGDSVTLSANPGGITNCTWLPGNSNQPSITSHLTQTYTVTIIDTVGCTASTTYSTIQLPQIIASVSTTPTNCHNNTGTATVAASGGTGSLHYLWNTASTTTTIAGLSSGTYTATVTDSLGCNTTAQGTVNPALPPANAGADVSIALGNSVTLTATGGVSYVWTPSTALSCDTCAITVASPTVTTTYTLEVTDSVGCKAYDVITIYIEIHCPTNDALQVPNAFSPNNDGVNDEFCLRGWEYCVNYFQIIIYDRWGEKVFESNDPNFCWNGMYQGQLMDPAVFVYYITASLKNKEEIRRKGNVSLVK